MNWPNRITTGRLVIAAAFLALLHRSEVRDPGAAATAVGTAAWMNGTAFVLFVIAAGTDWLDGWLARRTDAVTVFGRIADPFVDKVVTCGAFILFVGIPELRDVLAPWMVIVIVCREFLVSSLRGYAESRGVAFPASVWGKQKTLLQFIAIGGGILWMWLLRMQQARDTVWNLDLLHAVWTAVVWLTVVSTILSGVAYVVRATELLGGRSEPGA